MHNTSLDFGKVYENEYEYEYQFKKDNPAAHNRASSGFLNNFLRDKDAVLILMLILLLYSDNGDRMLILALIYIIS